MLYPMRILVRVQVIKRCVIIFWKLHVAIFSVGTLEQYQHGEQLVAHHTHEVEIGFQFKNDRIDLCMP